MTLLLSVTATAMTFAQQSGENNPLTPVEAIFNGYYDTYNIPYCTDKYFVIDDCNGIMHVYDNSLNEVYTVKSELVGDVFVNVPWYFFLVDCDKPEYSYYSFPFTQKLFNDDNELEYFAFDCEVTLDGVPEHQYNYYKYIYDGFKIMQTNGNCIAEVKLPEVTEIIYGLGNYIHVPVGLVVFVFDDDIYIHVYWNGVQQYTYKYNKENAGVTLVSASSEPSLAAYPNPVKAGQPLNIRCKQGIGNAVVNITGLNGTLVKSLNATTSAGGTLSIPTDGLAGGIYLYTVLSRNRVVTSGKLVVE